MKKLLQTVMALLVSMAMIGAPVMDAQTRGRGGQQHSNGARPATAGQQSRPSGGDRHHGVSGANQHRPSGNPGNHGNNGNHNGNHNNNNRPGNNRPGGNGGNHNGNHNGNNRPGSGPVWGDNHRPGGNNRPGGNHGGNHGGNNWGNHGGHHGGGFRPGANHGHGPVAPPPPPRRHGHSYRHHVPFFGSFHRPVPPPRWHYSSGGPVFGTILGVALGTALGVSLTALANNGYTVSSYGNNVVYLTDVPQMNYYWPDAALYYNNGALYGSQFTYSTPYYDMGRFNSLYGTFTGQYGAPVEYVTQGGVTRASWYGAGNRFVTLTFGLNGGAYYTTLSFGN